MKQRTVSVVLLLGLSLTVAQLDANDQPPTRAEVEAMMGLRSAGDLVRGQLDALGFVVTADQAEDMISTAIAAEQEAMSHAPGELIGGICPHDDHLYSARVTVHLTEQIRAPTVILIGVFHKARLWQLEDKLVFDSFQAWHGPWGPVTVAPLREELLAALDPESYVVSNTMHCREHSLESIVPFLQYRNRGVQIVPILVPYMSWERIDELSDRLATALGSRLDARGWRLGRDLAIVISNDSVHYGDDFDHTPFGTDAAGYQRAVERDLGLAGRYLTGEIRAESLQELLYTLVDRDDVRAYQIPWCGRFAVPFSLELMRKVSQQQGLPVPAGELLRYGTTLSEPELPVSTATRKAGLGYTAPSNLHHWVGFVSVGYSVGE